MNKYQPKNIKKIVLIFLSVFTIQYSLFSQNEKYFDPQPENFMKQLGVLFKENPHEELDAIHKQLEKEFKSQKINDYQLNKMCDILNIMYNRKMNVYPEYKNFITAATAATRSGYDEKFQDRWYLFVKSILENAKKGNHKDFRIFMDFSNDLFLLNALVADKSKTYQIETKDLSFAYENKNILVKVPNTNLKGFFSTDTSFIFNTSGEYNVMEKIWKGNSGSVNWSRVGFAPNDVHASFGSYTIDMSKPSYTIDSVKLSYSEYFPTPIVGRFTDMIIKDEKAEARYPQFYSYGKNYNFDKKIAPNVRVSGGFLMKGGSVVLSSEDGTPVNVSIWDASGTKKYLAAEGTSCIFKKGESVKLEKARTRLYVGSDSISHPQASVSYDVKENQVKILRDDYGSGKARYRSTYHKMSFDAEMLTWNLSEDHMDLKMLQGKGNNAAKFISDHNYDQETYNIARTASVEFDPLAVLSKMSNNGSDEIPLDQYIANYGPSFSAATVLPAIFSLEKDGFVSYNATNKSIKVNKEVVDFYLKASKGKIDYDLLRFKGYGNNYVGRLFTNSKKIEAENVYKLTFNDSTYVYGYPSKSKRLEIFNNRELKFNGKLLAGRLDFYGNAFDFRYDSFSIKSDSISKIVIGYPVKKDPATGEEVLEPLKSSLEKVKGELYINAKFNKSGQTSARNYPKLVTTAPSYVYYDHQNIFGGKYKREDFYFEAIPFKKDSLLHFDPNNLYYDGKLYSAKIFDPFTEKLRIMPDMSLGFITQANGFSNYGGKGNFTGDLKLSNGGLVGNGNLTHLTTKLTSDSILYFPNQTNMFAQAIDMKEQKGAVEFPQMSADSSLVEWKPYSDSMLLVSTKRNPFDMFNNSTKMHGKLILESKGLTGDGFLDFDEAKIIADRMKFKSTTMSADTSSMEIKNIGNKVTFKTPNVSCLMNFESKVGDFKSNDKDISTDFAANQYKAEINEFRWDMTRKILTFKAKEGTPGMKFTSKHPLQDSLSFYPKIAEYNMLTSIIKMDGVEEILVADSKIIPDNGKVNIFPDAKMEILKNSTVEGDTTNKYHAFTNCAIDVHGKYDIIGHGEYVLKVNNTDFPIKMASIKVAKTLVNPTKRSRKELYTYTIEGTGKVEKAQDLKIYRNTDFHGNVHVFMNKKYPHFEGMQRIKFINPSYTTPWFAVDNEINVAELSMYKKEIKTEDGKELFSGIMLDREKNVGALYTNFLAPKKGENDQIIFDATGTIKHLPMDNHYLFGDSAKILTGAKKGDKLDYSETDGKVVAEGKFNPRMKIGGIPFLLGGYLQNDLNENSYKFAGVGGMNITLDQNVTNALTNLLITDFATNKDLVYATKKEMVYGMSEVLHPKDYTTFYSDLEKSGTVINPIKYSPFNIVFTDLILEYDNNDMAFRSKPEFGISTFGGRPINKTTNGYVEFGYGEIFDYFTIYMKAKGREWIYMTYSDGQLSILTSNEFVNNTIMKLDPRKRIIKKSASEFYNYNMASQYEVESFVKRMSKGGKYNDEERRVGRTPDDERVSDKDVKNAEIIDDKSPEMKQEEAAEKQALTAEEEEIKKLEAELKALEDLKEKTKKAAAEKSNPLEDFSNENPDAPEIKKPEPKAPKAPSTPKAPKTSEKDADGNDIIPTGDRENPDESEEDKKKAEPEKQEEGQSLFDSFNK